MFGDLPPSSSEIFFSVPAAARMIVLPTSALPVNAILSTPGCSTIAAPAVSPTPVTMLTTPGGRPASAKLDASARIDSGVCSAGFSTVVHPAQIAGASFHDAISSG